MPSRAPSIAWPKRRSRLGVTLRPTQVLPQPRADSCRVRRISRPRLRTARNEQRPVRRRRRPCARGRHQPGSRAGVDLRLQSADQRQVLPQRSFDQGPERRVRSSGTRATHTRDRRPAVGVESLGLFPGRWPLHPQPRRRGRDQIPHRRRAVPGAPISIRGGGGLHVGRHQFPPHPRWEPGVVVGAPLSGPTARSPSGRGCRR